MKDVFTRLTGCRHITDVTIEEHPAGADTLKKALASGDWSEKYYDSVVVKLDGVRVVKYFASGCMVGAIEAINDNYLFFLSRIRWFRSRGYEPERIICGGLIFKANGLRYRMPSIIKMYGVECIINVAECQVIPDKLVAAKAEYDKLRACRDGLGVVELALECDIVLI
jgi:hypothetical protein